MYAAWEGTYRAIFRLIYVFGAGIRSGEPFSYFSPLEFDSFVAFLNYLFQCADFSEAKPVSNPPNRMSELECDSLL